MIFSGCVSFRHGLIWTAQRSQNTSSCLKKMTLYDDCLNFRCKSGVTASAEKWIQWYDPSHQVESNAPAWWGGFLLENRIHSFIGSFCKRQPVRRAKNEPRSTTAQPAHKAPQELEIRIFQPFSEICHGFESKIWHRSAERVSFYHVSADLLRRTRRPCSEANLLNAVCQ